MKGEWRAPLQDRRDSLSSGMTDKKPAIWITGATGGIGTALVKRLLDRGWTIAASGRDPEKLEALGSLSEAVTTFAFDATDPDAVKQAADDVFEVYPDCRALVHLVGSIMLKNAHQLKDEEWHRTLDLNLNTAFYLLRAVSPRFQKRDASSVVFASTVAAQAGLPSHEAIAAAKGGIDGLVRSAAATYASRGMRVNAVAPGMTETPMSEPILANEQARTISERLHPLGRLGRPEEIAAAIEWLVSENAGWVTGQVISIDGGLSKVHPRPRA